MTDEKKTETETIAVAGPIVAQATTAILAATQVIAPAPESAPIVLAQVPLPVPAATAGAATAVGAN